jgi:hypothetical protein
MSKTFVIVCCVLLFTGCKKTIEKIQENAVISAMTNGQWVIKKFVDNGTTQTPAFAGYTFQFHANKNVDAIRGGVVETTGTWDGDAGAMTMTANFPGAVSPLSLLNGKWHIDNNSWTYVAASQTTGTQTKSLRLEKL